jgi:hypothetical protein
MFDRAVAMRKVFAAPSRRMEDTNCDHDQLLVRSVNDAPSVTCRPYKHGMGGTELTLKH